MIPAKKKRTLKIINTSDEIKRHANMHGVSIILDWDGSTDMSRSGSLYSYDSKEKELIINVCGLQLSDKPLILELIKKTYNDGELVWKYSKNEALHSYGKFSQESKANDILQLFSKILSKDDFDALKMSFYVRDLSKKKIPIHTHKMDIKDRFGDRGVNICNLCSAGYFENELKSLYDHDTVPEFNKYYELVVGKKARALFVHSGMSVHDIETEVLVMVDKAIKYHMSDFRIHGIGKLNVACIKKFVSERTEEDKENYEIRQVYDDVNAIEYMVIVIR